MSAAGSPRTAFGFDQRGASLGCPGSSLYMWACWVVVVMGVRGGGGGSLNSNLDGFVCSTAELGYCYFIVGCFFFILGLLFVDRGRGGEVMGDGLAGADQTLTTSPTSLTRCRGPLPPSSPGERLQPPALLPHIPELSRLKSAEDFGKGICAPPAKILFLQSVGGR